jgi:peptidoglycan hydrolase-like protein with peptidoglycan-binding domain
MQTLATVPDETLRLKASYTLDDDLSARLICASTFAECCANISYFTLNICSEENQMSDTASAPGLDNVLSLGMEGPAVDALQDQMIKYGYLTPEEKATKPGRFGPRTEGAVKNLQRNNELNVNGTFDVPTQAAIQQLNDGVRRGSKGGVVLPMQRRLVKAGKLTQQLLDTGPGTFGQNTEDALKAFQQDNSLEPDGVLTDVTYRNLYRIEVQQPITGDSVHVNTILPDGGVGFKTFLREPGGATQFGTEKGINQLIELARAWNEIHPEVDVQYGHISRKGGIPFFSSVNPGKLAHQSHRDGRTVDIRQIRKDNAMAGTDIDSSSYDQARTRELVLLIRARFPGVRILNNDDDFIAERLTQFFKGHRDHLHVFLPA